MSDQQDDDTKEFEPSQRRLQKAREEGDVVRSDELQAAAATAGFLAALLAAGAWAITRLGEGGMAFVARPERFSVSERTVGEAVMPGILSMVAPVAALMILPAIGVLAILIASRSLVFAPGKLALKGSRLSVVSNARQKFGTDGLLDFAKRAAKMLVIGGVLAIFLRSQADRLFDAARMDAGQIAIVLADMMMGFLLVGLLVTLAFGVIDYLIQRNGFLRRNRMSRKEMTDEMKDGEGDPYMKAERRRRAQEIANSRMLTDVPKADVVIVNPTHYAVALKWDRRKGRAPVCVAKGVDEIAARIRERAQEAGIPIRRDPPTARALHAAVELGAEIRPEHYAAVAAAIRFADAMRKRARARRAP